MPAATVFLPLFVLFVSALNGLSVGGAFHRAFDQFFRWDTGVVLWSEVILLNVLLYVFAFPVFRVHQCCLQSRAVTQHQANMAMRHLNRLTPMIIVSSVLVFVVAQACQLMMAASDFQGGDLMIMTAFFTNLGQSAGNGFLVGVILALQFDNRLYRARQAVLALKPTVPLAYRSLYGTIFLVLTAVVVFFCFQIFSSSGSFFTLGLQKAAGMAPLGHGFFAAPDLIIHSGNAMGLQAALDVFGIKLLFLLFLTGQLLWLLKMLFKNPIDTVRERLTVLNSPNPGQVKQIDIVTNDEFAAVYREINTLILWQQDRLDVTRKRLEAIIEFAADPILSYDHAGKIRLANPAVKTVFGWEPEDLVGEDLAELFPPGTAALADAQKKGFRRSFWRRKDTSSVLLESSLSEGGGEELWSTVILRDVTLQADLEATLTRARTEAEHANQMKSEFLANMSHELRTPLNAILGFTQLLENDRNLTDNQVERIRIISRSGEHLLGLINDILDISKIEAGKMEIHPSVFDLPQFIDDLNQMFSLKCRNKGLTLYVETLEGVPRFVEGDLGKLRQILINLVGNAVKFTAEGGISILTGMDGDQVRFAVKDTGRGIPLDEQEKILQPFVQASTTDNEGGTGLGLAISSRYVAMMGGSLSVESVPDEGSTFSFSLTLPRSDRTPLQISGDAAIAVKPGHEVSALVVDDQVTNRLVLKEMLERAGFSVLEAVNGQQAIDRAREFLPPLIFMDIKMPVMDGYAAVTALKADPVTAGLKVFALTASAFSHDESKIVSSGFDGFLAKPFKQSALFQLIRDRGEVAVQFETAEASPGTDLLPPGPEDFVAARKALSPADLSQLEAGVLINDFGTVGKLAEQFEGRSPRFFQALERAAGNYDEDSINALLGGLK